MAEILMLAFQKQAAVLKAFQSSFVIVSTVGGLCSVRGVLEICCHPVDMADLKNKPLCSEHS